MTDTRLAIDVRSRPASVRLVVVGEIDPHTSAELEHAWTAGLDSLATIDGPILELDLAGVTFIDSSGLRVLIGANQAVKARGGHVVIHQPSATVMKLLDVTQLAAEFEITPT